MDPELDADRASLAPQVPRPREPWHLAGAAFAAVPVLFLCLFLLYPLARILDMGLRPLLSGGAGAVHAAAAAAGLGRLLLSSTVQALLSTALALVCGLPVAALFGRYDFPGKAVLRTLLTIPFVLPTVVVSSAFVVLIGSGGWLEKIAAILTGNPSVEASLMRSLPAVLAAHVFYNVAIVVRIVGGAWSAQDTRLVEAARTLGSGKLSTFARVTLRLLLPSISASALLVFAFCFSSFGVVLVLGGPRVGTLETEIYRQAVYMFNLPAAAILSVVQLATTALVMYAYSRVQSRLSVIQNLKPEGAPGKKPRSTGEWLQVFLFGILPTVALMLPMGALLAGSFLTRAGLSSRTGGRFSGALVIPFSGLLRFWPRGIRCFTLSRPCCFPLLSASLPRTSLPGGKWRAAESAESALPRSTSFFCCPSAHRRSPSGLASSCRSTQRHLTCADRRFSSPSLIRWLPSPSSFAACWRRCAASTRACGSPLPFWARAPRACASKSISPCSAARLWRQPPSLSRSPSGSSAQLPY